MEGVAEFRKKHSWAIFRPPPAQETYSNGCGVAGFPFFCGPSMRTRPGAELPRGWNTHGAVCGVYVRYILLLFSLVVGGQVAVGVLSSVPARVVACGVASLSRRCVVVCLFLLRLSFFLYSDMYGRYCRCWRLFDRGGETILRPMRRRRW